MAAELASSSPPGMVFNTLRTSSIASLRFSDVSFRLSDRFLVVKIRESISPCRAICSLANLINCSLVCWFIGPLKHRVQFVHRGRQPVGQLLGLTDEAIDLYSRFNS